MASRTVRAKAAKAIRKYPFNNRVGQNTTVRAYIGKSFKMPTKQGESTNYNAKTMNSFARKGLAHIIKKGRSKSPRGSTKWLGS